MSLPEVFTIEKIFASQKKFDIQSAMTVWQQFVKWCYLQFDFNRHISFGSIGDYGFKIQQKTNAKVPYFFFNQNFLKKHSLNLRIKTFVLKPVVKINYSAVSKSVPFVKNSQQIVQSLITYLIQFLEAVLSQKIKELKKEQNQNLIVADFDVLGKFVKKDNQIWFEHTKPSKKETGKLTSIRFHVDKQQNKYGSIPLNKINLITSKQGFFPKIQKRQSKINQKQKQTLKKQQLFLQKLQNSKGDIIENTFNKKRKSLVKIQKIQQNNSQIQFISTKNRSSSLKDFRKTKMNSLYKPFQSLQNDIQNSGWQMMGAGCDPLKKNQNFSKLTLNLKNLMEAKFTFNLNQKYLNIPVIDSYSRTLSCPIASQRQNALVAGRIGSNFCLNSQRFQITNDGIILSKQNSETLTSRLPKKKSSPINEEKQYMLVLKQNKTVEELQSLKSLKQNFERYFNLFKMVPLLHIIPFQNPLKNAIFVKDSSQEYKQLHQQTLMQIQNCHLQAIKKSVIDYILLDPLQRDRLGVHFRFKPIKIYGEQIKKQTIWPTFSFHHTKQAIQNKLMKNSRNILKIINLWGQTYQNGQILILDFNFSQYFTIDQFCDKQKIEIRRFRYQIINKWVPQVSEIYKIQISDLKRNMEVCQQFFDSASTLLYIKLRQKIFQQLKLYNAYFENFQFEELNPPQTVVHLQKTIGFYEKAFITVRISQRRQQIYFMDNIDEIENKLMQIVVLLSQVSVHVPRPENLITKTNKLYLQQIHQDQFDYAQIKTNISTIIRKNIENTKKCVEIYSKYAYLLSENKRIDQWIADQNHDRRQYSLTLSKYKLLYQEVMNQVPFFIRVNMILVDSSQLKRYFLKIIEQITARVESSIYNLVMKKNTEIQNSLEKIIGVATSFATTCDKLVEIETTVDNFRRNQTKKLQLKHQDLLKWISITLYNSFYPVQSEDLNKIYQTSQFLKNIVEMLEKESIHIDQQRRKLQTELKQQSINLNNKTQILLKQTQQLKEFGGSIVKDTALELLKKCRDKINQYKINKKQLNRKQLLLGMDETQLIKLLQWDKFLVPFQDLWKLVDKFYIHQHSWSRQNIFKQNSEFIQSECKIMLKSSLQLSNNNFIKQNAPLTIKVAESLSQQIKNFQKNFPLIAVFSNAGLKERHFLKIAKLLQFEGDLANMNLSLQRVLGLGANQFLSQLEAINQLATKQYIVEQVINKVKKQWQNVPVQMKKYKQTDINILVGSSIEEIQSLLDDHLLKVLSVKGSVYAKIFQEQIELLQDWLNYTLKMIQLSAQIQSSWMYLEPVMTSPDILKHLSVEGSKFIIVDQLWRKTTELYHSKRLIKAITENRQISNTLRQCQKGIQVILKGLNSYLESKRMSFPRFFFLSNDQLLQILSQTKDPTKVQPHLKKCFQGIQKLQFEEDKYILGMISSEKQYVPFTTRINTSLSRGNVDQWLKQVEQRMLSNVKKQIEQSHVDYEAIDRKQCLLKRCSMAILTVEMTRWTSLLENGIIEGKLDECVAKTQKNLQQVIEQIKSPSLQKVHILTLESLIVLSVHNLDITKSLQKNLISSIKNFEWETQLRYYICYSQQFKDQRTQVKILNTNCTFNHQYLGNTSRLVITPLTDRCYRTLCSAIYLNYGGAPQGPAGTGKTQTVKDLAKALACQCVVFNCSDGLDYKAMGKFFKGLAASGAWSCFDQFNRINLEVLSVVAQQILCIQRAKSRNLKMFFFEDIDLPLKSTANVFITMNPGYAGRSELPDNLKSLFRSVAMMVPDYAMIAEISLYSFGFIDARNLARKIVTTYKLCSQQLSAQSHYDYGMRAVKSVLTAAGNLKRKYPALQQSALILKSINDINFAKFLAYDIPLFKGITSDLFPGVQMPQNSHSTLIQKIRKQYKQRNLSLNSYAQEKIIQIYQMILVRHGIMIVGYPFSGKSTSIQMLQQALGQCYQQIQQNIVQAIKINPKSISMQQLYGMFDQISHEWFDGVLAIKFRNFAYSKVDSRKWLIFDGPVDAIWIQNMNTVLDDNKKLCLNSGQIIAMSKNMSLMFESMDLLAASPATVSRCGMIYFQPQSLGHQVLIDSWKRKNFKLGKVILSTIQLMFQKISVIYAQISKHQTVCEVTIMSLICTFLEIFDEFVQKIKAIIQTLLRNKISSSQSNQAENQFEKIAFYHEKQIFSIIGSSFFYSVIWSFGGSINASSRMQFQIFIKRLVLAEFSKNKNQKVSLPQKGSLYDYSFTIDQEAQSLNGVWAKWADKLGHQQFPKNIPIHEMIVKTQGTISYSYLIKLYLKRKVSILMCGPTGTGKTTLISDYFREQHNINQGLLEIVFSSKTSCKKVQQQIQSSLDKRGSKLVLGPKNSKEIAIFVDDLNLPLKQKYGAQPPIQLLRQLLDQNGFYDLKQKQKYFKKIIDTSFVFCMSSINNQITQRFLRHTKLISITSFDEDALTHIFSAILSVAFFGHSEQRNIKTLLKNCIQVYQNCLSTLLPTPAKVHYSFNLRDLWKLVIGICRADKQKIHSENIGRLWAHEVKRIFKDRLLPNQKHIVDDMINSIGKRWGKNISDTYFTNLLSLPPEKSYQQVADLQKVSLSVSSHLNNYNITSEKPMDLVLFKFALQHILIIHRIIEQPKGHALLIGLGGSGRKSFATLASFITQSQIFSIEVTKTYNFSNFRQDIKKLFIEIGVKGKRISWIFADTQVKDDQFLEDINNILNLGIVPSIYTAQQKIQICQKLRKQANQVLGADLTLTKIFSYFQSKIKNYLKLVLCFSPIGQTFRKRIRLFPSLINCTTIDWYQQWPEEGLISVAKKFLDKIEIKHKDNFIKLFQYMHRDSLKWAKLYEQEMKRIFYITPSSFLQFLYIFKSLLSKKRKQVKQLIYKYENGYKKILQTEQTIEVMKKNLEEMKPKIKKAAEETAVKLQEVQLQKIQADFIMEQVSQQQKVVFQAVRQADGIKQECEQALALALPQLKAAQQALLVLDKNNLVELKSMNNPPVAVKLVLQGLCLLIDPNPKQKMKNEKTFKMETDWWAASVRNLANTKLLESLVNFNKEGLNEKLITNLGNFLNDPLNKEVLNVANVAKSSVACQCIIQWINGIYNFYFVNKKIIPKKEQLQIAQQKARQLNNKLDSKRQELQIVNKKVSDLNYQLDWSQKVKQKLEKEFKQCQTSLERANIITSNLATEKIRWLNLSQFYKKRQVKIDANVLYSSAQVCYLGPFIQQYRQKIVNSWKKQFEKVHVVLEENINLIKILGSPLTIREWNMKGLPSDDFSAQNAIMLFNSKRWPLMIDPQQQANKWLKNQQAARKLKIVKTTDDNFIRNLQNCIQFGTPVLIENLGEQINVALNPILLKQTYKKGPTTYLRMGQNVLIYSNEFFLYMTTKLRNPHYLPQICTQVSLINFMITEQGLKNQLLSIIVSKQRPDLQQQKIKLVVQSASNEARLNQIENKILQILNNSQNILSDQTAINVLSAVKQKANQISQRQLLSKQTQKTIDQARQGYFGFAEQGSLLFFTVMDLGNIDTMYQYSLSYIIDIFVSTIKRSQKSTDLFARLQNLKNHFRLSLYRNVSKSLFEKDRLTFSVLISLRLEKFQSSKLKFLLISQQISKQVLNQKPTISWLSDKIWSSLKKLQKIEPFQHIIQSICNKNNQQKYEDIITAQNPFSKQFPGYFQSLSFKDKLLLYKCLRPEKMVDGFVLFVKNALGKKFAQSLNFDLNQVFLDSEYKTPILFILSPGSDPFLSITNFSKAKQINLESISLGQGQGQIAQRLIRQNLIKGGWIILQNCHLALSWMGNLVKILEELQDDQKQINQNFRMWLTSYPNQDFPQFLLQKSLKVTNQTAKGMKSSLHSSYLSDPINNQQFFDSSLHQKSFKKLIYSVCFFHALIQERRKFGSLGWNISYQFTQSDLRISCKQLKLYINSMNEQFDVPYKALKYLIGQCYYGGRVTDTNDRILLIEILETFFNQKVLKDQNYNFGNIQKFILPKQLRQYSDFMKYIESLPEEASPTLVGLHENANITKDFNESNEISQSLLNCSSKNNKSGGKGLSIQQEAKLIAQNILSNNNFPAQFDSEVILQKYPILYEQSMNTVLNQQISRYNVLISTIRQTLKDLIRAIKGQIIMNNQLQNVLKSLLQSRIPDSWISKSYPSQKSLGSYVNDFIKRIQFFKTWIKQGTPSSFWLSGFFFTQSFLTGVLQNYSRRNKIAIDQLAYEFIFFDQFPKQKLKDGAKVYGLFIEGASWNSAKMILEQSMPGELYVEAPTIILRPKRQIQIQIKNIYNAPLYKTLIRRGVLSTTGHSTNYVMNIKVPIQNSASHWIKRGVALFTQLND